MRAWGGRRRGGVLALAVLLAVTGCSTESERQAEGGGAAAPTSKTIVVIPKQTGDPFFAAAGNPASTLFDPNYRQFDVEGYRIYRGTSPANMQMIADPLAETIVKQFPDRFVAELN